MALSLVAALSLAGAASGCAPSDPAAEPPGAASETPGELAENPGGPTASPPASPSVPDDTEPPASTPPLDAAALDAVAAAKVFFGHRSVGGDIVEMGIPAVYAQFDREPPPTSDSSTAGWFEDTWLAQDPDPLTGVRDFDARVRSGIGADIAFMKIGYVDIVADTDVPAAFDGYRNIMAALEADYPGITFLHVTVTVTRWEPWNNVAIERYNDLIRAEYRDTGRLVDLARALSTCSDGMPDAHETDDGQPFHQLCEEYTRDGGHLSQLGAEVAAAELLRVLAAAV